MVSRADNHRKQSSVNGTEDEQDAMKYDRSTGGSTGASDAAMDHSNSDAETTTETPSCSSSSAFEERSRPLACVLTTSNRNDSAGDLPSLDNLDDDDDEESQKRRRRSRRSGLRYVGYVVVLWLAEFLLMVVLKNIGVIEPEFRLNEAVRQNFPQLELLEQEVRSRWNESSALSYITQEKKRPGFHLAQQGATAHYPVVMVPGFVTSGLEVWGGKPCARKFFRQRLWAAVGGATSFLMDRDCWKEHMMLDAMTGGDPEGIRLRAASGFDAADYFLGNYWVWGKLIENLADVGYTPSTMAMEPYDWRLAFPVLEERDGYLSRLRSRIEDMHHTTGKKVVLTTHSMGALLVHYFFAWVTTPKRRGGGGGGKRWVDEHIHSFINIAGSHLGVPKASTALLSGEMSDTVMMGTIGTMVEQFFGRRHRRELWSTWGALWAMLPKGGNAVWGAGTDLGCPTDEVNEADLFCSATDAPLLVMPDSDGECRDEESINPPRPTEFLSRKRHELEDILDHLIDMEGPKKAVSRLYSLYGKEKSSHRTWHDPSRTPLPYAPNMHVYCMYGTGIETERAYYYRPNLGDSVDPNGDSFTNPLEPPVILDSSVNREELRVKHGVRYADGDGSVPLVSLGYLCADAWTRKDSGLNPSSAQITTREYRHQAEFTVDDPMRSGPRSAEHVDILGNVDMMEDLLRVATDFHVEEVQENRITSDIQRIASEINKRGGVGHRKRRT